MKIASKLISIVMTACIALGMAGCSLSKTDIEELKKNNGVMLEIICVPQMAMTQEEYESSIKRQTVTYKGEAYNPNPINKEGVMMSDKDYKTIYEFCVNSVKKNKFKDYSEDVCDGETYTYIFYDIDGQRHIIYDGYCYENKELCKIRRIVSNYCIE